MNEPLQWIEKKKKTESKKEKKSWIWERFNFVIKLALKWYFISLSLSIKEIIMDRVLVLGLHYHCMIGKNYRLVQSSYNWVHGAFSKLINN